MFSSSALDFNSLESNKNITDRNYWRKRLEHLELSSCFDDPDIVSELNHFCTYGHYASTASLETYQALIEVANSPKAQHIILLSVLGVLAYCCSKSTDITIFYPLYRSEPSSNTCANIIPIRISNLGDTNFSKLLPVIKNSFLSDLSHGRYSLEKMLERDSSALKKIPATAMMIEGEQNDEIFDLLQPEILFSFSAGVELKLNIKYNCSKFGAEYIERIAKYYFDLLVNLIINKEKDISKIDLISEHEKQILLYQFNDTEVRYSEEETIITLFQKQCLKTPGNPAILWGEEVFTYKDVLEKSDQIALYLQKVKDVKHGDLVGLLISRGVYLIPAILGILKTGAAYVPIDSRDPSERICSIIQDANLEIILTEEKYNAFCLPAQQVMVDLNKDIYEISTELQSVIPMEAGVKGKDPAYVIYTSGTTGQPKGVVIEHHSVVNRLLWMQKMYPLKETDVLLQKTPLVFDVSIWELFWWSFTGASLCLLQPEGEKDPRIIINTIKRHRVTRIHFVPSMLSSFLSYLDDAEKYRDLNSLGMVFSSGEALKLEQVRAFEAGLYKYCHTRLINLYGPTEATVDVSYFECEFGKEILKVPIGKPIDNIKFYILDKDGRLCPTGFFGELCIAGAGLGRGYLNKINLTVDKFILNSYVEGERLYKTGDVTRWLPGGELEYAGRTDNQVKLRGIRIELGEIENLLVAKEEIRECTLVVGKKEKGNHLVAYYTADKEQEATSLRNYLAQKLPDYMIPAFFVWCEKMPLTPNGKLDKQALPEPWMQLQSRFIAPLAGTETKLTGIWSEILKIDPVLISASKSFFELGGNSLKLLEVNIAIKQALNVNIPITEMFRSYTIKAMAKFIKDGDSGGEKDKMEADLEAGEMQIALELFKDK